MHDMYHKFTSHLKEALVRAYFLAKKEQRAQISPQHLFLSLAHQRGSLASEILHKRGVKVNTVAREDGRMDFNPSRLRLDQTSKEIVQKMVSLAFEYQHHYVGTEHLLAAILKHAPQKVKQLMGEKDADLDELEKELESVLSSTSHFPELADIFSDVSSHVTHERKRVGVGSGKQPSTVLESFSVDLTSKESQEKIDPVIGRAEEIERLIQVLTRRTKNNPLLLGDPGVGKTAIVEGLAKRITKGDVPPALQHKRILSLDLSLVVAGTMYRGEFESRLKQILEEIKRDDRIIIFIDEVHNIIGAGSSTGGTLDAANILKPALARGDVRCIGATTLEEYRKTIESDPALERRFQPIIIREPSSEETIKVLKGVKQNYEAYHHVRITDQAIAAAVELSERYLPEKFFPDKAIDLLDEAAARARLKAAPAQKINDITRLQKTLARLEEEKESYVLKEQFDEAWKIKSRQKELERELQQFKDQRKNNLPNVTITGIHVAELVSQITGIPLDHMHIPDKQRFRNVSQMLTKKIVGQAEAIEAVASFLRRAQTGLSRPHRPLGTFMFLGPSGVGKTALAKAIAEEVFESADALVRVDMSEFSEKFNISKLIGAPPGYVGYKEGGALTERVRRRPYCVVLFDEIEKAHSEVFNLLLQIMDEGHVTDAVGKKINFRNSIIIMTSNIGAEQFNMHARIGFSDDVAHTKIHEQKETFDSLKHQIVNRLDQHFKPEFLNRIDRVIVFNPLTSKSLVAIVDMELRELKQRLSKRRIKLEVSQPVKKYIAGKSFAPNKGAREIARQIQECIEQPLVEKMINKEIKRGDVIKVNMQKNKLVFTS